MGGKLTGDRTAHSRPPRDPPAGDLIDGQAGDLRVLRADSGIHPLGADFSEANAVCNALPESEFEEVTPRYVVKDGDCIRIIFGETGS